MKGRDESSARRHVSVTTGLHAELPVSALTASSDRFQLICEVGQGGMATVSLALMRGDAGFNKLVALKQPKPSLASDDEFLEMFLDEARLAARLNHPHVVQTYEVGRHGEKPFIAMEFLEGQPLHRIQRVVPEGIPLSIHLRIIADALSGLHHAHELCDFSGAPLGVVHRDMSPQNLLVSYDGQTKIVDFGIAKAITHGSRTEFGLVKGKLPYMSPEQILGEPLDRGADIFSIGVMLWEAGARARLWPNESARSRLRLLSLAEVPKLSEQNPRVPPELDRICARALEYSRARRYQTAAELEADVDRLLVQLGEPATRREVAAFMRTHFEAERQRTRKLLEEQLGHLSLDSARKLPAANSPRESSTIDAPQATRRLSVPMSDGPRVSADGGADTPTTVAPATATVSGRARSAGRGRWLGAVLLVSLAAAIVIARIRTSVPQVSIPGAVSGAAGSAQAQAAPAIDLTRPSAIAAANALALASAAPSPATALRPARPGPISLGAVSRAPLTASSPSARPATDALSARESGEPEIDLSRLPRRDKKPMRALDVNDPWGR